MSINISNISRHQLDGENAKHFKQLFHALIIGLIVGLVGGFFRNTLSYIENIRDILYHQAGQSGFLSWLWPILFAIIGISIALFLVKKYAPEASGSGVQEIEGALDGLRPMRWKRVLPIKFIASLFSLGSGLLLGREGPTIQLGANIGKMVKDTLGIPDTENNSLISAGAAAGLASAFNAPFAGIIFVIEEMNGHFKFNFYSLATIMIGAGTSDFIVRVLIGSKPIIQMTVFPSPNIYGFWLFICLGLLCSIIGLFYNKLLIISLDFFQFTSKLPFIYTGIFVGLSIAVIGIFSPDIIGGGYDTIAKVLDHSFTLSFLLFLFIARMLLSLFSYSFGMPGGIFLPMLTLGVILGMLFGVSMQQFFPQLISNPGVFTIAGMAGIFAATVRAPLTGLVLAVEMTSNYELILPLIITTVTASVFTSLLGNKPIYTTLLKRTLANVKKEEKFDDIE
ncbi:H(+)/Cl(-) exchange transporter ClcA [Labilibaculum sp. A4]|uniref:H(+)/Cl(-) exchange transporter ClcA n=1 Tax=Labilibaculum euxinus TaxID=2686357 RepID=UPI000F625AE7|nr:H(+)/Cl(-) exchange transporter ClcA [Labilibaculum euxinus]MDQ1772655.1 H(+)/Cl(-) exchange transporter ClcA [Labilibaculum euxinus]MWN76767.1 H(+)/Cl(-) exchange transporter ClcA [Labilibaculum euxinus]